MNHGSVRVSNELQALLAKRRLLLEAQTVAATPLGEITRDHTRSHEIVREQAPVVATPLGDVIEATPVGGGGGSKR